MSHHDEDPVVVRRAGRVVLIADDERVLLFRASEVGGTREVVWYTPGGGVEDGETYEEAACRELWEETGKTIDLGPCMWRFELDLTAIPAAGEVHEYRRWSIDDIERAGADTFIPRRLVELLRPLLAGEIPGAPVDASDDPATPA